MGRFCIVHGGLQRVNSWVRCSISSPVFVGCSHTLASWSWKLQVHTVALLSWLLTSVVLCSTWFINAINKLWLIHLRHGNPYESLTPIPESQYSQDISPSWQGEEHASKWPFTYMIFFSLSSHGSDAHQAYSSARTLRITCFLFFGCCALFSMLYFNINMLTFWNYFKNAIIYLR